MSEIVISEVVSALRSSLSLTTSLSFLPGNGTRRDVALVTIRDSRGAPYYGEVAPLPSFSVETVDDALSELDTLAFSIPPLEGLRLPLSPTATQFLRSIHCPSLRCGLEGVILDYLARTGELTTSLVKHPSIECNGLILVGEEEETYREIQKRIGLGFRTLKIKISPSSIESTLRAIRRCELRSTTKLRLDANRSFSEAEWASVAGDMKALPIEYVEEPVRTPSSLKAIIATSALPIAIDETTRDTAPEEWLGWGLRAVVLKPSLNGGLISLLPLISMIERNGAYVTLSSSFESGIGLRSIALLASLMDRPGALGVDTASFLKDDLTEPPFPRSTPSVTIDQIVQIRRSEGGR